MAQILLHQALVRRERDETPRMTAFSLAFDAAWSEMAVELAEDFGVRPAGVACPLAVFAHPWLGGNVAVVRVFDVAAVEGEGAALAFHFLVLSEADYGDYFHNPFTVARRFPHPISGRDEGMLPELEWTVDPPGPRQVWQVQEVLQRLKAASGPAEAIMAKPPQEGEAAVLERTPENSQSPALLGGTQVLVDGGKLYFQRSAPDQELVESLWMLLPLRSRGTLWPASFTFSTALQFDVAVLPRLGEVDLEGYVSEDEAANYPEGRYELALQVAAEAGDQDELNRLFRRRTQSDTLRLALKIMVGMLLIAAGFKCATSRGAESALPAHVLEVR